MAICPLCGRRVMPSGNNCIIVDGTLVHKKCPTATKKKSDPSKNELIKAIYDYYAECPRGYIVENGFNKYKLLTQIKQLYEQGYSYEDQHYALDKVVEMQNGFWGYGAVVNKIDCILAKKHKIDEVKKSVANHTVTQQPFDLSKLILDEEDEW